MIFEVKPAVVGHRGSGSGAAGGYRENSLESFLAAAASGATWVELDVRRSSDDELVVWHDPHTPAGLPVVARTASQLAAEGIIELAAVLSALPAGVGVDMDVKTVLDDALDPAGRRTHALVAAALGASSGTRPILVSSFDPSVPLYLRDRTAGVALGLLISENLAPDHGLEVMTWTATPAQAVLAAAAGIDAVCVDDVPGTVAALAAPSSVTMTR